jgi:hypothetical protein
MYYDVCIFFLPLSEQWLAFSNGMLSAGLREKVLKKEDVHLFHN